MFSIQKDHVEIKKTVGSLNEKLAEGIMTNQESMMDPRMAKRFSVQYYNDEDAYMDDNLREQALNESAKQIQKISNNPKPKVTNEPVEHMHLEQDEQDLQELTYEDLTSILSEHLGNDIVIDSSYELKLDCADLDHQTLLELLSNKILPKLRCVGLQNMQPDSEIIGRFLCWSLQNGVDWLILNEYSDEKACINFYIMSIQFLLGNNFIHKTFIIRDVEMTADIFGILINSASQWPITLEIQWMKLEGFEDLKIAIPEEDQALIGLEITYSELGDQGKLFWCTIWPFNIEIKTITEELKRSGLAKSLQQLNFQGNKEVDYNHKAALSDYKIRFES
jgi:hypothetical protein